MKVLFISPYLPHPKSGHGTGVFMYGLLHHLVQRHEVTLAVFCDDAEMLLAEDLKSLPLTLRLIPRTKGRQSGMLENLALAFRRSFQFSLSLLLWQPYYVGKFRNPRMAALVRELTQRNTFDVVQIEFAHLAPYRKQVQSGAVVLHEHDVAYRPHYRRFKRASNLFQKMFGFFEWCRWAHYEPALARKFDHVVTVTDQDRRLVQWLSGSENVSYLRRGVDVPDECPSKQLREPQSLVFVGTFGHHPNVDAVEWLLDEIYPLIHKSHPQSELHIIGSRPPEHIHKLASSQKSVHLHGYVDDLLPYLDRGTVFIAPLRYGGGVKLKIMHAMARGIPVVTTGIGIEGIDGINSDSVMVGDSAARLAKHVVTLFDSQEIASSVGGAGYELVKRLYSWGSVVEDLEQIYTRAMNTHRSRTGNLTNDH